MLPNAQIKSVDPAVKLSSGYTIGTNGHRNKSDALSGRGLAHRMWTLAERIAYAADVAMGVKHLDLSRGQLCSIFHITPGALRAELKARANGNGHEDAIAAAAKQRLSEAVAELGIGPAIDLLCDIERHLERRARVEVLDVE